MKLDITVNKYLLIWHLLYQSSVSDEIHNLKQQLWKQHKKEYSLVHKDKEEIIKEREDFIPDDENRRCYIKELTSILKFDLKKEYKIFVVHPNLDVVETNLETNIMTIGRKIITRDKDNFLTYLVYKIIKNEISKLKTNETEILDAVVELAITNELYTRVTKESKYKIGKKQLRDLKEKIYPYWLMYLGVPEKDFETYMIRDNIFFDKNSYKYEKLLKTIDIYSFIAFLIKNKKAILKTKLIPVEDMEVL